MPRFKRLARLSFLYIPLVLGCEGVGASYNFLGPCNLTSFLVLLLFLPWGVGCIKVLQKYIKIYI